MCIHVHREREDKLEICLSGFYPYTRARLCGVPRRRGGAFDLPPPRYTTVLYDVRARTKPCNSALARAADKRPAAPSGVVTAVPAARGGGWGRAGRRLLPPSSAPRRRPHHKRTATRTVTTVFATPDRRHHTVQPRVQPSARTPPLATRSSCTTRTWTSFFAPDHRRPR